MSEEWLPVLGQEGFYEVSSDGRARSVDRWFIRSDGHRQRRVGRELVATPSGRGYPSVMLRHGLRRKVHVLVCEAFHGPKPSSDLEVAHWDGNMANNSATNLRWATKCENSADTRRYGLSPLIPGEGGERNGNASLTWAIVDAIREACAAGATQASQAIRFAVSKSQVQNIVSGKHWDEAWRL